VEKFSRTIEASELVANVGPNGAGKSTTMMSPAGNLVPPSGEVTVHDNHPFEQRQDSARNIGWCSVNASRCSFRYQS
jgi:ABC-type uncharacterized transport system ATPase subunit